MKTVKDKLKEMLIQNGMFESQAEKVIENAIPELNKLTEEYRIDFNGSSSSYPKEIYSVLYIIIKPIALKWIEDNIPMAWYKPMFQ